ncbi:MAG: hypothetical protein AAFN41_07920, partial [Planctomycetota bacterium]
MSETVVGKHLDLERAIGVSGGTHSRRRWILRGSLLAVAAAIAVVAINRAGENESGSPGYLTQFATRGDLVMSVTATGNLEPTNSVDI